MARKAELKKRGRPPLVDLDDPTVVDELCARIAEGRAVLDVCGDDDMPTASTVYRRMAKDADFATAIARAREAQQHHEADSCVQMADQATAEDWQVVKLRIWARQWRAAKLAPKTYGDKLGVEQSGSLTVNVSTGVPSDD